MRITISQIISLPIVCLFVSLQILMIVLVLHVQMVPHAWMVWQNLLVNVQQGLKEKHVKQVRLRGYMDIWLYGYMVIW